MLALAVVTRFPNFPKPTIRIVIHQGVEGVPLKRIAEQFSSQYSGRVQVVELPYDQLFKREMEAIAMQEVDSPFGSRQSFDVIQLDDPWLPALAGGLLPVDAERLTGGFADF